MRKLLNLLFSRLAIVGLLIVIQALTLIMIIWKLSSYFVYLYALFTIISLFVVLWLINTNENPAYKLAWTVPILIFPVFGGLFYLFFGGKKMNKRLEKKSESVEEYSLGILEQDNDILDLLWSKDKNIASQARYIYHSSDFPIYENTQTMYLSPGEVKYQKLLEELKKAQHFIFLEYFIIAEGIMWDSILEILKEKVADGVDVRVMYDDCGCLQTLPYHYDEKLRSMGIKCLVFNPFRPNLSVRMNNRDHRKIAVIDGYVGFTGGVNLADEYINAQERFGHWKDASIMLKGEAVWNLTVMFLQVWNFFLNEDKNYAIFHPSVYHPQPFASDGYVQPYGDSPMNKETIGEFAYLNMINGAKDYIYINTPYLVIDNELFVALSLAAKKGVDVRIVTPHIADKWYVHMVTQAYYHQLVENGVKIYEYGPGFIHSKTFVCDDEVAIIGTINLDYRSLYLHYECSVWLYKSQAVYQLRDDFVKTLAVCLPITKENCGNIRWYKRFLRAILRAFAPLM